MQKSQTTWLVSLAMSIISQGANVALATAQTTYPINANYSVSATTRAITPDISVVTISGESADAPYGLTTINGLFYSQVDPATGLFRFNTDPITFGLQDGSYGSVVFGSGENKLFGTNNARGVIDFETLRATASGTFTITGGEGIFAGATGALPFSEVDQVSLDPNVPTRGQSSVNGSFQVVPSQVVPEPRNGITLLVTSMIGAGILLRRWCKLQSTSG